MRNRWALPLPGFIFLVTQYFQFVQGFSPLGMGLRLIPVAGSVALSSIVGTRLAVRSGDKVVVTVGLLLFCIALFWISTASQSTTYVTIALQMLVLGTGMGFSTAPATEAIMGAITKEKAGVSSAINDATRLFGGTLGVAVIGSVAASLYTARLSSLLPRGLPAQAVSAANGSVGGALAASQQLAHAGLGSASHQIAGSAVTAFLASLHGGTLLAGGVAAVGALVAWRLLPARPSATWVGGSTELSLVPQDAADAAS